MTYKESSDLAPADAFKLLSDDIRIEILRALTERRRTHPHDPALSYSDLCNRVGIRDSGRFNYHLKRLREHFVTKTDTGYKLSFAGVHIASAIYAGTYNERAPSEQAALDHTCPSCVEPLLAIHENEIFRVECPNEHEVFRTGLPAGAVAGRSMDELVRLVTHTTQQDMERATERLCPLCYGQMKPTIVENDEPTEPEFQFEAQCVRCGMLVQTPVGACVIRHPAVISFYHEHGVDIREQPFWTLEICGPDATVTVVSNPGDPLEFCIPIYMVNEVLQITIDATGRVLDATTKRTQDEVP